MAKQTVKVTKRVRKTGGKRVMSNARLAAEVEE